MSSIADWSLAISDSIKGRLTLLNILHDHLNERLPKALIAEFLREVSGNWEHRDPDEFPEDAFHKTIDSKKPVYLCKGNEIIDENCQCSRIMNIKDFVKNNLDYKKIPISIRRSVPSEQISLLERLGLRDSTRGVMGNTRNFAWVTKSDLLDSHIYADRTKDQASEVREQLGLYHYISSDENLIEIRYPIGITKDLHLHVPTFLEGCPSFVYRSKTASDGWGRAVNLNNCEDGFPEAVHESYGFTDEFCIKDIGRVNPKKVFDYQTFERSYYPQWNSDTPIDLEGCV